MMEDRNPAEIAVTVVAACAVAYAGILWWLWPRDLEQEAQRQLAADASVAAKAVSAAAPAKPPGRPERPGRPPAVRRGCWTLPLTAGRRSRRSAPTSTSRPDAAG